METITDRWHRVWGQVQEATAAASRPEGSVRLVAVSKMHPAEAVVEAFRAGARDFGENYVQELASKQVQVAQMLGAEAEQIRWHFIGHLQTNKLRKLKDVTLIHSVDRWSLVKAMAKRPDAKALLQVNIGAEESKGGFAPDEVVDAVGTILEEHPSLVLGGLMTIPPPCDDREVQRRYLEDMTRLLKECHRVHGDAVGTMTELSMGMSADFEQAIAAGATLVRIGTAIFGSRR